MKLLLYSTKANKYERLVRDDHYGKPFYLCGAITENFESLNGKIVAECDYEVEEIEDRVSYFDSWFNEGHHTKTMRAKELITKSCLDHTQLTEYLGEGDPNEVLGYAIHIKNLHIFDEPKELSDYYTFNGIANDVNNWKPIEKAPQNMMYAYELISELGLSGTCNMHLKKNIVISIRPEWLCKILNKEKTIEVRRVVLKEMLK
jgi:predicted transcriptional regulator